MIQYWFPKLTSWSKLDMENKAEMLDRVYAIKENNPSFDEWKCDTYTSIQSHNILDDLIFAPLIFKTVENVKFLAAEYGVDPNAKILCTGGWVNVAEHGNFQEFHIHTANHFSAVYYLKATPKCGNILLRSEEGMMDMFPLPLKNPNDKSYQTVSFTPEEDYLLVFRSNINHMVEKNFSEEDRISIAMNFLVQP